MFANIPPKCIVLFEDFDTYFDKRVCLIKNEQVRFTFDAIINSLDGVYNDYKGVFFVMTANDIDKIDDSLRKRPSRFRFVKEFSGPSEKIRRRILQDDDLVRVSEGFTLDQVFHLKDGLA
jgi:AAA+ superfamily predicted ATPase